VGRRYCVGALSHFLSSAAKRRWPTGTPIKQQQERAFAKVSSLSLQSKKRHGNKITVVTAYDYPSGMHAARASIDILLVGDSVSMVELGHETTQPVSIEDMLHHCKAVRRGVDSANVKDTPLLLGDMVRRAGTPPTARKPSRCIQD